ncbi:hypothetical protein [Nostoc sp.]|uniref:hypothetical protein n=1 Tax=Nostoc sp. TaxID=1180 RepID=UPI002FF9864A
MQLTEQGAKRGVSAAALRLSNEAIAQRIKLSTSIIRHHVSQVLNIAVLVWVQYSFDLTSIPLS